MKSPKFPSCTRGPPSSKKSVSMASIITVSIPSVKCMVIGGSSMVGREGVDRWGRGGGKGQTGNRKEQSLTAGERRGTKETTSTCRKFSP
jgi:hypothetical protein